MMDIKSIGHRFPLDINCGSPPNRRTTDIVCSEDGCNCTFSSFSELELHIEAGIHESSQAKKGCETIYDTLKLEWAAKFSTIDTYQAKQSQSGSNLVRQASAQRTSLNMGWARRHLEQAVFGFRIMFAST